MKKHLLAVAAASALAALSLPAVAAPAFADVMVMMDESGSMAGEQAWIAAQIPNLNTGLVGAGLTPNQYGLIGFGYSAAGAPSDLRGFNVATGSTVATNNSPGTFGSAANFQASAAGLVASGGFEDGWAAIALANTLGGRSGAARNYILVTDEDRDVTASPVYTYAGTLNSLTTGNILLNAIVNATFRCGSTTAGVLGISSGGAGYIADGLGGYTTASGCSAASGDGTTIADYVDLAIASGGAAWNLNLLRAGGLTATSFTNAFIDIKVQEITNQTPEPGTLLLAGAALLGLGAARRRKCA